jgi:hypothetical protein
MQETLKLFAGLKIKIDLEKLLKVNLKTYWPKGLHQGSLRP